MSAYQRTAYTLLIASLAFFSLASHASAGWKKIVSFKYKNKDYSISVSDQMEAGSPIKGVVADRKFGGFESVLAYHGIAKFSRFDGKGPSTSLMAEAAKAAKRPELKYAGAIVTGCSKHGRKAAQWAGFNQSRTLAVFLDHSWTALTPHTKPANDYSNVPILPGIPMLFTATHDDKFQGGDRRSFHYHWCKNAYTKYKQPCTTSIYYKKTGHCRIGSTEFQKIWLKEALVHRLPKEPAKGSFNYEKPYKLRQVSIASGGGVYAKLISDGGRSLHSDCIITKFNRQQYAKYNFWLPGPESAAKYAEWTKLNKGRVSKDFSKTIPAVLKVKAGKPVAVAR